MSDSLRPQSEKAREPLGELAAAFGLGRTNVLLWRAVALLAMVWAMLTTGWALYEVKTKPTVEPVMVLVDDQTRVVATATARTWTFPEQARSQIAQDWLSDVRTRPLEEYAVRVSRARAAKFTRKIALPKVGVMLKEIDDGLKGNLGLALSNDITAQQLGTDPETGATVIRLEWRERTYDDHYNTGPWQDMTMNVTVEAIKPIDTAEIMANGYGMYVTDFSAVKRRVAVAAR